MGFKKGQPRPPGAGRKKGTPNKKTLLDAAVVLATKGLNPTEELLKLIPNLKPDDQAAIWKFLVTATEPKKSVKDDSSPASPEAVSEEVAPTAQLLSIVRGVSPSNTPAKGGSSDSSSD